MTNVVTEPRLKEFAYSDTGPRFRKPIWLDVKCPQCGAEVLEDTSPPNYWQGETTTENGIYIDVSFSLGGIKYVCERCRIAFKVGYYRKTMDGTLVEEKKESYDIVPLVEKDGWLLTPHDVWREKYKQKHGQYPHEVYG